MDYGMPPPPVATTSFVVEAKSFLPNQKQAEIMLQSLPKLLECFADFSQISLPSPSPQHNVV